MNDSELVVEMWGAGSGAGLVGGSARGGGPSLAVLLSLMRRTKTRKKKKRKDISVHVFDMSDILDAIGGLDAIAQAKIVRGGPFGHIGHELQRQVDMD